MPFRDNQLIPEHGYYSHGTKEVLRHLEPVVLGLRVRLKFKVSFCFVFEVFVLHTLPRRHVGDPRAA